MFYFVDDSIVVSAPTGSGKTAIFELAIVKLLMKKNSDNERFKIIYSKLRVYTRSIEKTIGTFFKMELYDL